MRYFSLTYSSKALVTLLWVFSVAYGYGFYKSKNVNSKWKFERSVRSANKQPNIGLNIALDMEGIPYIPFVRDFQFDPSQRFNTLLKKKKPPILPLEEQLKTDDVPFVDDFDEITEANILLNGARGFG